MNESYKNSKDYIITSANTVFMGSYASPNFASQNFTNTDSVRRKTVPESDYQFTWLAK